MHELEAMTRNVGLCVNTELHISHTASRTAERKMSRAAKDDDPLLVHDSAASARRITHALAVIQNTDSKTISCYLDNRVSIPGTNTVLYLR
jgi:hypothetical protein